MGNFYICGFFKSFLFIVVIGCVNSLELNGPFLIWGNQNLQDIKSPALSEIDESALIASLYESDITLLFLKEKTQRLDERNFPCLSDLIKKEDSAWSFFYQLNFPVDIFDNALNTETVYLESKNSLENDKTICEIFNDRVKSYGNGKVLGIISNSLNSKSENISKLKKRTTTTTSVSKHPILYIDKYENILLYTDSYPILKITEDDEYSTIAPKILTLNKVNNVEVEGIINDGNAFNLTIYYDVEEFNHSTILRFLFKTSFGYWSISSVEVETESLFSILNLLGDDKPNAPFGFSYWCSRSLLFMDENENSLKMNNIQVEPFLQSHIDSRNQTQFNDAYDCVGFITVPILSGILISFFIFFITLIGIVAIMDIKTPTRFDKEKSKPLTIILSDQDIIQSKKL